MRRILSLCLILTLAVLLGSCGERYQMVVSKPNMDSVRLSEDVRFLEELDGVDAIHRDIDVNNLARLTIYYDPDEEVEIMRRLRSMEYESVKN